MPWPVYLALKHMFPTGRRMTWATARRVARNALIIATAIFAVVLLFLWARGMVTQVFGGTDDSAALAKHLGLVWLCLVLTVAFVMFVFQTSSFFNGMSILGVMLGVMVLLVVQSVMNGFFHAYQVNLIKAYGHIRVWSGEKIAEGDEVIEMIKGIPGVKSVEPIAFNKVMLKHGDYVRMPAVRSFAWPDEFPRSKKERAAAPPSDTAFPDIYSLDVRRPASAEHPFADTIIRGSLADLNNKSMLVSYGLARFLNVDVGDKVEVYTDLMLEGLKKDDVILPREFTVAGIFQTGWTIVDDNTVILTLRATQEMKKMGDSVDGFEVRLDNDDMGRTLAMAETVNAKLSQLNYQRGKAGLGPLFADTWLDSNSSLLEILLVEKTVMFYIMIFIVVVAAFSIASSLVTSVVRKTREIGVLGALGARRMQVAMIFCLQGLFIGLAGTALGVGLAFLLLNYRQDIVDAVVDPELTRKFYRFYSFPVEYRTADFVKIIVCTLAITTLAGLVPAWLAARLKPAECLRQE